MATMITSECINCGACEPECPNTAIYQGGVQWEFNGAMHPAIATDIFYIVPDKCTECVGFFDHEACAAVCPVDACVPNPDIPETEEQLIARAGQLHPDKDFGASFPSRFRKDAVAAAAETGAPAVKPAADAKPKLAVDAAPKAAAPAKAAASPGVAGARVEKPLLPPKPAIRLVSAPPPDTLFPGELGGSFDDVTEALGGGRSATSVALRTLMLLGMPLLGALPDSQKKALEEAVGDRRFFSAAGATGLNIVHNMLLYPIACAAVGVLALDRSAFTSQLSGLITLGIVLGSAETVLRLRDAMLHARPAGEAKLGAAVYGLPLAILAAPLVRLLGGSATQRGTVGVDGFHTAAFEDKTERERRYGEVYTLTERANGYLLRLELPRRVPPSAQKLALGIPDEMPDYKLDLQLRDGFFVVRGKLLDENLRKVAGVSPAFPPDFVTQIRLMRPIRAFKHRYQDKVLEVALLGAS